ncbi:MAG: hypothetical protein ACE5R5_08165 [Nitrosarchaeum sp.]
MVLGIIIAVGVAAIIVIIIIKLVQSGNGLNGSKNTKTCITCGRKTNSLICQFCKKNTDSLR